VLQTDRGPEEVYLVVVRRVPREGRRWASSTPIVGQLGFQLTWYLGAALSAGNHAEKRVDALVGDDGHRRQRRAGISPGI
jgi:hypothetical protein